MAGGLFERYAPAIAGLPPGPLTPAELMSDAFRLDRDAELAVYYIPFERMNPAARVVLIGITPGFTQMQLAYEVARDGLVAGLAHDEVLQRVDEEASFAGSMRTNLTRMLDDLELPSLLGIGQSEGLFREHADLLHSTSALRNPVFVRGFNYTGSAPPIDTTPLLRQTIITGLGPELASVPSAVLIPLGGAAERALQVLIAEGIIGAERCCLGFPHPSGANGHRVRLFQERREQLRQDLRAWFDTSPKAPAPEVPADDAVWSRASEALASALTQPERDWLAGQLRRVANRLSE